MPPLGLPEYPEVSLSPAVSDASWSRDAGNDKGTKLSLQPCLAQTEQEKVRKRLLASAASPAAARLKSAKRRPPVQRLASPQHRRGTATTPHLKHQGIESHALDLWHRVGCKGLVVRLGIEPVADPRPRPTGTALALLRTGSADPELLQPLQLGLGVIAQLLHLPCKAGARSVREQPGPPTPLATAEMGPLRQHPPCPLGLWEEPEHSQPAPTPPHPTPTAQHCQGTGPASHQQNNQNPPPPTRELQMLGAGPRPGTCGRPADTPTSRPAAAPESRAPPAPAMARQAPSAGAPRPFT